MRLSTPSVHKPIPQLALEKVKDDEFAQLLFAWPGGDTLRGGTINASDLQTLSEALDLSFPLAKTVAVHRPRASLSRQESNEAALHTTQVWRVTSTTTKRRPWTSDNRRKG